jgi:two-component system vancomycin resistance associated response regulator VraR
LKKNPVDVIVLNLMLKSSAELEAVEEIQSIQKDVKIIMLMDQRDELIYNRALQMGVKALLPKDTSYSELISDIVSVGKGNDIVPDFLMRENVKAVLSEIETQVLELMANEYTNEEIAKELYMSRRTVESHVTNIFQKLGVNSRIGAVREAIRLKLVQ